MLMPELDDLQELRVMLSQRMEQWAEEFIAQGEQKGLLEGEARLLGRQLTRRFGELPAWVKPRLKEATEEQLATWSEAVLDAATLVEVFVEPPANH